MAEGDILRAAVVLLHASLEDLLRSVATVRLPGSSHHETLKQIPFPGGDGRRTTFTFADLSTYRGQSVDNVFAEAVAAYLARSSYNNTDDIAALLGQIGLPPGLVAAQAAKLQAMMRRRHFIAHRLDQNEFRGRGHHHALSISKATVVSWIAAVVEFGTSLLRNVETTADNS